ncbi:heavy metal translocating P-type ATPase [Arsukibacterium indicum]|uniref:Cadmium-translocating P-type ATPase n=1 Tax=Arsukibacterium indicum TaxID=2848612 RepID=A0ABS6MLM7_9GAMM|nr:heavy metal translocating P-type ATPase [Arsukibacterium indicum]MBV2129726.1 cadmium-translocating P-type ATPase [Arsukibacterium indicum]
MTTLSCFHCLEPVITGERFQLTINGKPELFCCAGCQAVAQTIIASGLDDYYKFRTEAAAKAELIPTELRASLQQYDSADVLADISQQHQNGAELELAISGMSCAACAWLIEKHLNKHPAVNKISINSSTQRALLNWQPEQLALSEVLLQINQLGYQASPFVADQMEHQFKAELNRFLKRLAVSGIMTMQVMMLAFALYFGEYSGIDESHHGYLRWISMLLTLPVVLYAALPFVNSAWRSIKARQMNMDVPVSLAIYYTFFASAYATVMQTGDVYFESVCMFTFLLQLGKFFEYRARAQARDATSNLLKIMPVSATLLQNDQQQAVSARRLVAGDIILVKPGETLPADGMVLSGSSTVDESMLTGEYTAISRQQGDMVLAGSINHDGLLTISVSSTLVHSRLGQIIQLQQQTLHNKPRLVEKTDQLARYFVERLLLIAAATFALWYFWLDADRAFWVTLSVLVATCPCALSLATPTAITCALSRLNRLGILVKNSQALETLPELTHIIFDKTGTLTEGRFSIVNIQRFQPVSSRQITDNELLNVVANLEQHSEHPIARAFVSHLKQNLAISQVTISIGQGISGIWQDQQLRVGSAEFCQINNPEQIGAANANVFVTIDQQLVAAFTLADNLRPHALTLIRNLQQQGYRLGMLTGDSSGQAAELAADLNLDFMQQGCSPADKVAAITALVNDGHKVLMLGDGINDSPGFNAAHISVAVDSGTDLSKNQADVVLLKPDISLLAFLLAAGKQASGIIRQNLLWAVGYNLLIIPLAVAGLVSPYIAVLGMSFSSLLVVSNSLRLLKK